MNGDITLKAGKYTIAPLVDFEVRQSDHGIHLTLRDERVDVIYHVQLDDRGKAVEGGTRSIKQPNASPVVPRKLTEFELVEKVPSLLEINKLFRSAIEDPFRCIPALARSKFTLRFGARARNCRQVWPIAGYKGDGGVYILFRYPGMSGGEQLLWIVDETHVILRDDDDANRLPRERWSQFFHLPLRETFSLNNRVWRKMNRSQINTTVSGKIFAATSVARD